MSAVGSRGADMRLSLADGFDFPVGKPEGSGYYKARGFWPNGHLGEDWNGKGGGNTDLGDPVYACADGIVVQSKDIRVGWGNVVIIRHVYRETDGSLKVIDSLYGHLNERYVTLNQRVKRGQKVGAIGTNRGMYLAHLHFEIRKNLAIGMNRSSFDRTLNSYHDPTKFIRAHRKCESSSRLYPCPMNTFAPYGKKLPSQTASTGTSLKIPVDNTREDEIKRMVSKAKSKEWRPPATTQQRRMVTATKPSGSSSSVTLNPKVQEIVKSSRITEKTKPQPEEKRSGFWTKFKDKFSKKEKTTPSVGKSAPTRSPLRRRLFGR